MAEGRFIEICCLLLEKNDSYEEANKEGKGRKGMKKSSKKNEKNEIDLLLYESNETIFQKKIIKCNYLNTFLFYFN